MLLSQVNINTTAMKNRGDLGGDGESSNAFPIKLSHKIIKNRSEQEKICSCTSKRDEKEEEEEEEVPEKEEDEKEEEEVPEESKQLLGDNVDAKDFAPAILSQILTLDQKFGTCPPSATSAASCNPNVPLLASVAVPDILRFASNAPDGYPNGRQLADRTTDILISLIVQLPGFTDGTSAKTYCSVFPFVGPPLQLSGVSPFEITPQTCP